MTQMEVAECFGVSHVAVIGWLNGAIPRPRKMREIAKFFGVSVEFLMNDVSQKGASDKADIRFNLLNNLSPTFIRQVLQFGKTTKRARIVQIAKELALLRIELESESLLTSKK